MAKGAKQKSNVILMAAGSKHARKNQPVMRSKIGAAPKYFGEHAREKWDEIVPQLDEAGTIAGVDRMAMEALCLAYQRLREAQQQIDDLGVIFEDPQKGWMKNPACTVATAENNIIARLSAEFGLTAASRGRVVAPPRGDVNPFDEF
jgi:P27 family predicted phage terminase small subunit